MCSKHFFFNLVALDLVLSTPPQEPLARVPYSARRIRPAAPKSMPVRPPLPIGAPRTPSADAPSPIPRSRRAPAEPPVFPPEHPDLHPEPPMHPTPDTEPFEAPLPAASSKACAPTPPAHAPPSHMLPPRPIHINPPPPAVLPTTMPTYGPIPHRPPFWGADPPIAPYAPWALKGAGKGQYIPCTGGCGGAVVDQWGGAYLEGGGYMAPDGTVYPPLG